jgi:hypothetical protein
MPKTEPDPIRLPHMGKLSKEEQKSITHGGFWIQEAEREIYKRALAALNEAGVPYVVAGAYAIYEHTGIYRQTKDLDLFCEPAAVIQAMEVLRKHGFRSRLEQGHWLAKALDDPYFIDIIYGMGNGLALIDRDWFEHSSPATLAATSVRVAPVEELIWHRLFINERHRQDMADIAHLILCKGQLMDWRRLMNKTGEHWPLLLAQVQMFRYVYPGYSNQVPTWVLDELLQKAREDAHRRPAEGEAHDLSRGTLISRFSFAIDVNEWLFQDEREKLIRAMEKNPAVLALEAADVWDERASQEEQGAARETPEEE